MLGRGVLRLIEQHEGVAPGAPAHDLEGREFYRAVLARDVERCAAHALAQHVEHGGGPGREFVVERAGEEAERAPAGAFGRVRMMREIWPGRNLSAT